MTRGDMTHMCVKWNSAQ